MPATLPMSIQRIAAPATIAAREKPRLCAYESRPEGTYFKTVYDYDRRYGILGRALDGLFFRRLLQLSTEWGFETLRLWCAGEPASVEERRSRARFLGFYLRRLFFGKPAPGAARSWLGSGRTSS